jgi:uncharacterized membrane protein
MAVRDGIGNTIAPLPFIAFIVILIVAVPVAMQYQSTSHAIMIGFDVAAVVFLLSSASLLGTKKAAEIREHAQDNDANRVLLLSITGVVMTVLLVVMGVQTVGGTPETFTKVLIISTLAIAWLFSNTVYALHYAHLAYLDPKRGCSGIDFPGTEVPVYWDFLYFAFTLGMTFQTSDVQVRNPEIRRVVVFHCMAAFVFNIGILAFTIGVIGG